MQKTITIAELKTLRESEDAVEFKAATKSFPYGEVPITNKRNAGNVYRDMLWL